MARGRIAAVARTSYAPQELPVHITNVVQGKAGLVNLFYQVTTYIESPSIDAYGRSYLLKAGMLLEADIVQEKRRLYEWVLDPIYAVTGKILPN